MSSDIKNEKQQSHPGHKNHGQDNPRFYNHPSGEIHKVNQQSSSPEHNVCASLTAVPPRRQKTNKKISKSLLIPHFGYLYVI